MEIFSKALRLSSFLLGTLCLTYGFIVGIVGFGPEGQHSSIFLRFIGVYVLLMGILYIIPSEIKMRNEATYRLILFIEFSPSFALLVAAILSITSKGLTYFMNSGGFSTSVVLGTVSLISPTLLLITIKRKPSNNSLEQTGKTCGVSR